MRTDSEREPTVREMRASDWEAVADIYGQGIAAGNATFQTVCPSYEAWDASHLRDCRLVCDIGGRTVGFAVLSPVSARECYRGVAEVSLYVDEKHRRMGVGRLLLKALMERAEQAGFWTLYSSICSINAASLRLHESCGFRVVGTRERIARDRFGAWQDTTLVEWRNRNE